MFWLLLSHPRCAAVIHLWWRNPWTKQFGSCILLTKRKFSIFKKFDGNYFHKTKTNMKQFTFCSVICFLSQCTGHMRRQQFFLCIGLFRVVNGRQTWNDECKMFVATSLTNWNLLKTIYRNAHSVVSYVVRRNRCRPLSCIVDPNMMKKGKLRRLPKIIKMFWYFNIVAWFHNFWCIGNWTAIIFYFFPMTLKMSPTYHLPTT